MRTGAAVLAIASVIFLGACGGGGGTPSAPSTPAPTPASRAEVTVSITPKNAVSFTDECGNQMILGASATVVSVEQVRF